MNGLRTLRCMVLLFCLATPSLGAQDATLATPPPKIPAADAGFLLGAHRGGRNVWPENTAFAYTQAMHRWPHVFLEGDLQTSSDGHPVLIHDDTVDRTTNGTGPVKNMTLAELQNLDAGFRFTTDGGKTFPFRGQGIRIPTLREVLDLTPKHRLLIEIKRGEGVVEALVREIRATHAEHRFYAASINPLLMRRLNELAPDIMTCFDLTTAMAMLNALRYGNWEHYASPCAMMSIPPDLEKRFGLTPAEIAKIQAKGIIYQVFTINKPTEMEYFINRGVDSILSDNPDLLADVIAAHQPSPAPTP